MTATNSYYQVTLSELAKRVDPKGDMAVIAEVLNRDNPIINDAPWIEANNTTSHILVRRHSLPTGTWRMINQGVSIQASQTKQVTESMGMLENYSDTDKVVVDMAPNPEKFRMDEAAAIIEGMGQELAYTMIYGNAGTDIKEFTGFAPRMGALDASNNVIGQGGTGSDVTSIYIIQWRPDRVFVIYPKGSPSGGISRENKGQVTLLDASGNKYEGYEDWFRIHCGLAVKDPRCIARLANIESSGTTNTFDEDNLIKLMNRMPNAGAGATLYVNATIKSQMEIKLKDKANVTFSVSSGLGGEPILSFRGCPVKKLDVITNAETAIS